MRVKDSGLVLGLWFVNWLSSLTFELWDCLFCQASLSKAVLFTSKKVQPTIVTHSFLTGLGNKRLNLYSEIQHPRFAS